VPEPCGSRRRRAAFPLVTYLFAVGMLGTTLPTPLYVIYQGEFGFSSATVTVIYATYALGVLASLLLAGHASDTGGRRPVLFFALGLAALSTAVFVLAPGLAYLFTGRALSGLAAGLFTGTATAMLLDLAAPDRRRRASLVATAANMGGLGLGPLLAGLFAEYAPRPTVLVFEVYLVMLAFAVAGLAMCPETIPSPGRPAVGFRGFAVPARARHEFGAAAVAGFSSFSVLGLFSALAPSFLGGILHEHNHAAGGAVVFAVFAVATLLQVACSRLATRPVVLGGLALLVLSLGLIVAGLSEASLALFVLGSLVAGAGAGLVFMGSLATANQLAPDDNKAQVVSTYFVVAYLGLTIPVIGVGIAAEHVGDFEATLVCSVAIALLSVLSAMVIGRAPLASVGHQAAGTGSGGGGPT
jgi:MFS family permease